MFENLGDTTIKALLTAGIASFGSIYLFGEMDSTTINGTSIPNWLLIGAASGGGSWVADSFSDNILRKIPQNPKYAKVESLVVRLGLAGATTAAAMKITTGLPNQNIISAVALGASSKSAGEWINDNVISVKRSGFII